MDNLRHSIEVSIARQRQKWAWLFALGRVVAGMFLWPVLGAIALVLSTLLHLQTPLAQRIAAERVSALVSDLIAGELRIGRFDRIGLDGAVARHVSFYDAKGTRVITANRVTLALNLPALLYGTVHIPSAEVRGGTLRLIEGESGLPTLIEGFAPVDTSPSVGPTLNASVENIHLRDMTLYGALLGLEGIVAKDLHADGQLLATPGIEVTLQRARARLVAPFPFEATLDDLTGLITDDARRGIELHAQVSRDQEHATASVTYATPLGQSESILDLRVHADPVRTETLRDVGYDWAKTLSSQVKGDFRLHGPIADLSMNAQLQSDGGPVEIDGFISEARGVSVSVRADDLDLPKVVPVAPPLRVSGLGRIELMDGEPDARVHVELSPLLYAQVAIPALELDGRLVEDGVQIEEIRALHVPGGLSGRGHVSYEGRVRGHVRAHIPDLQRDVNMRRWVPDLEGGLRAELDLDVDPARARRIDFRGTLALTDVRYGALSAKRVELSGYARGDRSLPRVDLRAKGEGVRVENYLLGNADFMVQGAAPEYVARGSFEREGQRAFHMDAKVQASRERLVVNADQIELAVGEETWRGVIQQLELIEGRSVAVSLFRLASRTQRLEAKGIVRFDGEDEIDAQLQGFDVTALRAIFGKHIALQAGYLDTNFQLRGDLKRPQVLLQGAVTSATVRAVQNINGLYFLAYENGALQVDSELSLEQAGTWTLSGTGVIDTTIANPVDALRAGRYDLSLSAQEAELPALLALFEAELPLVNQALMSGTLHALGTLDDPTVDAVVELTQVTSPRLDPIAAQITLALGAGEVRATLAAQDARGELLKANGSTLVTWAALLADPQRTLSALGGSRFDVHAKLESRALRQWPWRFEQEPPPLTLGAEARLHRLRGRPEGELRMQAGWFGELPPSACNANPIPTGEVTVALSGDSVNLLAKAGFNGRSAGQSQMRFVWPIARWLDGGALPLPSDLNGDMRVEAGAIERIPYACDVASGRFYWRTSLSHLWTDQPDIQSDLRAELRLSSERKRRRRIVQVPSCPNEPLEIDAQASADRQWATANGNISGCGGSTLMLTGRSPITWIARSLLPAWDADRPLDASATFNDVQLKPLLDRIPGVFSAEAIADGNLTISGTPKAPRFAGSLDVTEGAIRLTSTGQNLTGMAGRMVFHDNWIEIQELHANDERGRVQLAGGLGLDAWSPRRMRFSITTDQFPVRREGAEMASISANALLQATFDDEHVGMDLGFSSLAVRLPDDAGRTLQTLDEHADIEVVGRTRAKLLNAQRQIGIRIHSARPFWVRRSDFSALIDSDLNVAYSDPELAVGGYVEFNRGVFDVFGKTFNLERGSIRFDGSTSLNPELNLIAVHDPQTAGSSAVRVTVTGRLSAPEVHFSAQGCDDESGALSLLLTGRCNLSDSGPDNNPEAQRAAFVGGLLAGVLTLGAKRELGALVPVIGIESTGQGFNQRIRAGIDADTLVPQFLRPIVRRAYVEGAVTTGQENQDGTTGPASVDFLLELYFPHNFVGSGRMKPGNNQVQWGVDVVWEP